MTACQLCHGSCCESVVATRDASNEAMWDWLCYHGEVNGDTVKIPTPCRMFKDGLCTIYPTRPKMCRDFLVGSPLCLAMVRTRPNKADIIRTIKQEVQAQPWEMAVLHD